ncbi:MAG: glycosyltransferase [Planctomycetes bacterium]|nr:glycosyltransferase [Planctomycetota bacterium]
MRILFVSHSAELHGAEYSLLRLLKNLIGQIDPIVLSPPDGPFPQAVRELGITIYDYRPAYPLRRVGKGGSILARFLPALRGNLASLKDHIPRPDLVHSNTLYVWEGALLASCWGVPHVWNLREILAHSPTWTPLLPLNSHMGLMGLLSDRFICVSEALRSTLPEVLRVKSTVIHNGLDPLDLVDRDESRRVFQERFGIAPTAKVALTVGNFIPEKAHRFLLPLMKGLCEKHEDLVFLWVGRHDFCHGEIMREVAMLGLSERVVAPGAVPGFGRFYRGADVYILSSETEAFPTVVLESLLAGVPVVARACGGVGEILEQGGGELVPLHEGPALAEAVDRVLCGSRYKPCQLDFSMKTMAATYLKEYEGVAALNVPSEERRALYESILALSADLELADIPSDKDAGIKGSARRLVKALMMRLLRVTRKP